jgi:UDP-glucuronate decarboxylase
MTTKTKGLTLVAGGAGFIGSHLCRALLKAGDPVVCLDNLQTSRQANILMLEGMDGFEFVEGDIIKPLPRSITRRAGQFTRVYNLACPASPPLYQIDPEHTMLTNVVGTGQLLRFAEKAGARFLLSSTSEVYGDPEVHPQPESYRGNVSCIGPRACYDEGKRAAETLAFDFLRACKVDARVARIFNTYGPNMRLDDGRVISNLVCQALSGEPLTIYGDGSQTRSFCYVGDTVTALWRLMEVDNPDAFPVNIGNPQEISINELVETLMELLGTEIEVEHRKLPVDDPRRRRPDISRAKSLLDWRPATPLRDGLKMTLRWFAEELQRNSSAESLAVGRPAPCLVETGA